jgi:hypothetical protein
VHLEDYMTKQLTDTALRALVAQWTRAALGELVEDDSVEDEDEQNIIAALQSFCNRVEEEKPTGELPAPTLREKEESNAYPGS